jgi:bifunctional non-homologous end joining protein LigD
MSEADLREYRRKRRQARTPEPFESRKRGAEAPIFVVQRHQARRLHYDFRLERDGALASWAVPKGVPLQPGDQRLAVHVEDHPLDYADFEGQIPAGEYGAGSVEIWDRGTYELLEEKKNGGLTVRLHGERLQGTWALVPARLSGDPKNWLILRKRDETAPERREVRFYAPMLATLADEVPRGEGWAFEVKWDGYRALAYLVGGEVTLRSRRSNDLSGRFPSVVRALPGAVRTPDCVLDGEVCALDEQGRPSFSKMQQGSSDTPIVYEVFDVLELDGVPLIDLPLGERRERLRDAIEPRHNVVRVSEVFEDGQALLEAAEKQHLEGVVAKRLESRYQPGRRNRDWLKIKTHGEQEFVIAGYTRGKGRRASGFGSLILAVQQNGDLVYVGNVGTGFSEREIQRLLGLLRPLERDTPPFPEVPKMPRVRTADVVWVEPDLVAEARFAEWTHDGHLRAPVYVGLREDKSPDEVRRELPTDAGPRLQPVEPEIRKGKRTLRLSNLDKPFWPEEGIAKGDLLSYYRAVASAVVPHLKNRPFTMKRYPDGWKGKFFFQKDAPSHMPDWIPTVRVHATTRDRERRQRWIQMPIVNDELALLWMVNMGCIDLNVWYSRVDKQERPDFVLFDLDPAEGAGFREAVQVALLVKEVLDAVGLESYPKTSGTLDGFHVLVPIARRHTYAQTREFTEIIAGALARAHHGLVTTEWTKAKRRGVLIDANQNGEGKTIASVYSVRPQPGAPVSTPLRWDEVTEDLDPRDFTMEVVVDRIDRYGDLFGPVLQGKQSLTAALDRLR